MKVSARWMLISRGKRRIAYKTKLFYFQNKAAVKVKFKGKLKLDIQHAQTKKAFTYSNVFISKFTVSSQYK